MQGMQRIKISRPRLAEMVIEQIISGLQSGAIAPDQRLHQEKLAEALSVSRRPVQIHHNEWQAAWFSALPENATCSRDEQLIGTAPFTSAFDARGITA